VGGGPAQVFRPAAGEGHDPATGSPGVDAGDETAADWPDQEGRVLAAIDRIAAGGIVVVTDHADREDEGDLVIAASAATPEKLSFFLQHTAGLICVGLEGSRADELELAPMVGANTETYGTAFTVSVDFRDGLTSGISAVERARTIAALGDRSAHAADFTRPGHVFPLRARAGGVLERAGHTEAAVDLSRLAGKGPAGALCEVVSLDKCRMARGAELLGMAAAHGLPVVSIADLIRYRLRYDTLVKRVASGRIPSQYGELRCEVWRSAVDGTEHLAIVHGDISEDPAPLVRVHSECLTGDVLGSERCDCGMQLDEALRRIQQAGRGVVVYLRGHEGRGIGLAHKLRAYNLQDEGLDTVDANTQMGLPVDTRDYGIGAQILRNVGVRRMRLMTNNPAKYTGLEGYGLEIVERVALPPHVTRENLRYLSTKRDRLGHLLPEDLPLTTSSQRARREARSESGE
jgi:3,4-dihydroxy 2-butanone 4-phosphate synthase/GTP cyclohydrolase II